MAVYQRSDVANAFNIFTLPELSGNNLGGLIGANALNYIGALLAGGVTDPVLTLSDGSQLTVKGTFTDTIVFNSITSTVITVSGTITGLVRTAGGQTIETLTGVSASLSGAIDYNPLGGSITSQTVSAPNFSSYFNAADQLNGGTQNDLMMGFGGNDTFSGGGGVNTADYSVATTAITATIGSNGTGTVTGGSDVGTDTLTAMQNMSGGSAGDTFVMSDTGANTLDGRGGTNTVNYGSATHAISATVIAGNGTASGTDLGTDTLKSIQVVVGGAGADLFVIDAAERVDGGAGFDTVVEASASVTVVIGGPALASVQEFVANSGTNAVSVAVADTDFVFLYGGTGNDALSTGSGGGYLIDNNGGTNTLGGGGGANVFLGGGTSHNTMNGGSGVNTYYTTANDTIHGAGTYNTDVLLQSSVNLSLGSSHVQQVILAGGTNIVTFAGSVDFDYIYGGAAGSTNTMTLGAGGGYMLSTGGVNHMFGGTAGSDVFVGGVGTSDMHGGGGVNTYYAGAGDTVFGGGTYNTLVELSQGVSLTLGSAGLQGVQQFILNGGTNAVDAYAATTQVIFFGGNGADRFGGGTGNDFYTGGTGANTFVMKDHWGADTVTDWGAGSGNKIDLTALASVGVHAITDLTISIIAGNDVIKHGTDTLTLTGFAGTLAAGNFLFA